MKTKHRSPRRAPPHNVSAPPKMARRCAPDIAPPLQTEVQVRGRRGEAARVCCRWWSLRNVECRGGLPDTLQAPWRSHPQQHQQPPTHVARSIDVPVLETRPHQPAPRQRSTRPHQPAPRSTLVPAGAAGRAHAMHKYSRRTFMWPLCTCSVCRTQRMYLPRTVGCCATWCGAKTVQDGAPSKAPTPAPGLRCSVQLRRPAGVAASEAG